MFHASTSLPTTLLRGAAAGAAVSALALTAFAGPAAADAGVFRDQHGDVSVGADIERVRLVNDDTVRIRVTHRDLRRSWRSGSSISVFLDTDRQRSGPEYIFAGGTFEGSDYALQRAAGWRVADPQAEPMRCSYAMTLDYATDVAAITIGRGCLGRPGAVRVAVRTGGESAAGVIERDWLGERRELTPWVRRG